MSQKRGETAKSADGTPRSVSLKAGRAAKAAEISHWSEGLGIYLPIYQGR